MFTFCLTTCAYPIEVTEILKNSMKEMRLSLLTRQNASKLHYALINSSFTNFNRKRISLVPSTISLTLRPTGNVVWHLLSHKTKLLTQVTVNDNY